MKNRIRLVSSIFLWLLIFAIRRPAVAEETPSFALQGFATIKAYGLDTTTGGGNAPVTIVRTMQEFLAAAERTDIADKRARNNTPRVIQIANDLDLGELANDRPGEVIKNVGRVDIRSNTTIFSLGTGATIHHGILDTHGGSNIIIRNLKFRDLWENDPTGKYDRYNWDFVRITSAGKMQSHHVWIDHCDFGKCYDGQIDITHGSDLITVSWCHFSGDERGPHKKSMLIGHSSSASATALDRGKLNVTLHHNWWENIMDRTPRVRTGNIHAFDNFIDGAENATISVTSAVTLVENCFYKDTRVATTFSHAKDTVSRNLGGTLCVVNSRNESPRAPYAGAEIQPESDDGDEPVAPAATPKPASHKKKDPNRGFELAHNFKSSVERAALQFNAPAEWAWENRQALPYAYRLDSVEDVPPLVTKFAGTGKMPGLP